MGKKQVIFDEEELKKKGQKEGISTFPQGSPISPQEITHIKQKAYKQGLEDAEKKDADPNISQLEKEGQEEGIKEHQKEDVKEEVAAKAKLEQLDKRENILLFKTKTYFPFDLFPDTLIIDTTKIIIIRKEFFASHNVITINLKDLMDVAADTALFLGNVTLTYLPKIESTTMIKPNTEVVRLLKKNDALRANYILKGILVAKREEIDIAKIPPEDLVKTIERFGTSKESPLE